MSNFKKLTRKQRRSLRKYGQFKFIKDGVVWTYILIGDR